MVAGGEGETITTTGGTEMKRTKHECLWQKSRNQVDTGAIGIRAKCLDCLKVRTLHPRVFHSTAEKLSQPTEGGE